MFFFNFSRPKRAKALAYLVIFSLVLSNFSIVVDVSSASPNPGAIWTTLNDCGDSSQNVNSYSAADEVWINGDGFSEGSMHDWNIIGGPGGSSSDPNQIVASDSDYTIDSSGAFCFNAYTVLSDDNGVYNVDFGGKKDNYNVKCTDVNDDGVCDVVAGLSICLDRDHDTVCDEEDNCPDNYNTDQADSDGDGIGDACEIIECADDTDCATGEYCNAGFCEPEQSECNSTVSGYKYLYDGQETTTGLAGWEISLKEAFGSQNTITTVTDVDGYYEFIDICYEGPSDEYRLYEYVQAGWNAVSPFAGLHADVFIDAPNTHLSRDFYNEEIDVPSGELKMCKQNDQDGDGDPSDVDPMLKNWDFTVDGQTTYNDADDGTSDGCATIDLPYGTYNIDEVLQSDWTRTGTDGNGTEQPDGSVDIVISADVTYIVYFMNQEIPDPETATIIAHKIVCDSETDLPNWSGGVNINAATAQNYIDTHSNCRFEEDWKFEWGINSSLLSLDGDYIGEHNVTGWYDFDSLTDINGKTQVELNTAELPSRIWLREVLPEAYLPFSFPPGPGPGSDVSAEFWCNNDVVNYDNAEWINISPDNTYHCVAFNVFEEGYCGDGIVNQDWEQCDPGAGTKSLGCTEQCQWEKQNECSDLTLARVNVHEYSNQDAGDLTDDIYLGSDSNVLPNGTWFAIYWNGAPYNLDADILSYEDVEGLAVQRLADSVRLAMHASQGSGDIEIVDATLEFYNASATGYSSDLADNNKLESGGAYPDSVNVHDSVADFYLWANTGDDGFYVDWDIVEDCIDPYGEYCGDGEVNQGWEQCDPGVGTKSLGCTEQCRWEEQKECSDLVLAKVYVDDVQNWGNGDMSSDLYLGSSSYIIPHDTWFAIYWNGSYFVDPDIAFYEDVPGLAVQRLEDSVRTVMYGTGTGSDKEHVSGHVEFYNATLEGQRSDESNDNPGNNRLENGGDGNGVGDYDAGDDEVWEDGEQSMYWLTTTTADDGFYSDWAIIEDCEEGIRVCKYDTYQNPLAGWEMTFYSSNLVTNGGFEYPTVVNHSGKWERFDSGEVDWDIDWVDDYSGEPILELQTGLLWNPSEGSQYAELDSDHSTEISQDIDTLIGADYELGFAFSPRAGRNLADNKMQIDFGTVSDMVEADGSANSDNDWTYHSYNYTATSLSTNLKFTDLGTDNSYGTLLDDVVVRQVASDITSDDGCVLFKDLSYGTYEVYETMQDGWTQIEPADLDHYVVEFSKENYNPTVSFINEQEQAETYDVHGYKWNDENGNGEYDCESNCEEKLSGWTINLYEDRNLEPLMTMDTSSSTEHFAWYWFENLPAGNYRICEELQGGWEQTYPGGCHLITLPQAPSNNIKLTLNAVLAPEYNFGNKEIVTYCGDGETQTPNDIGTGGPSDDGYEDCDDGPNGSEFCTSECVVIEDTPEEYCGDGIVNGQEDCDDGTSGSESCTIECRFVEEDDGGSGPGGGYFPTGSSGFFNPGTPSTPEQVLGTKLIDEGEDVAPAPTVLGFKELPNTGANSNIFYASLFFGLMSLLYAGFVQTKSAEEK